MLHGVVGCRIIDSPRERLIAILTNAFVPCNGRFPFLITISSIFIGSIATGFQASMLSTLTVLLVILLGIYLTLVVSKILSNTILKGIPSSFILELPPYRKPQIGKVIVRSLLDRTLYVLGRAIAVAAPVGIVIWLFANIYIGNVSILTHISLFLDPFAKLMGMDGYILTAFVLGIPANEIVIPILLMYYSQSGMLVESSGIVELGEILKNNGWTIITALCAIVFSLNHFPCATTLWTIAKETKKYVFIIGGESIYQQFLPYCERAYVTKIYQTFVADTYFKNLDNDYHWKLIEQQPMQEEEGIKYAYLTYENQQYQQNAVKKKIV